MSTVYLRLRASNGNENTNYSETKNVSFGVIPNGPILTVPTVNYNDAVITWTTAGSFNYLLEYSTKSNFEDSTRHKTTATTYTLSQLGTYYIRISAYLERGLQDTLFSNYNTVGPIQILPS
jgi:hypothetical protein